MPSKNRVKQYIENTYYHIYNRGVEKRLIFQDEEDYKVFLSYLKIYLEPPKENKEKQIIINTSIFKAIPRPLNNFNKEIELAAYCLMPNHFHLLVYQKSPRAMESFMRSLGTKYSYYFNKKYNRVGYLFQGSYKAVLVEKDSQLLHLTRYIHLNPVKDGPSRGLDFSSYEEYLETRKTPWIKTQKILAYFKNARNSSLKDVFSYKSFVEDYFADSEALLGNLGIDNT